MAFLDAARQNRSRVALFAFELTLIGWVDAFIWAVTALNRMYSDRRTDKIIKAMKK